MRAVVALLFIVSAISADTTEHFKAFVRPEAEICKEKLGASDDDLNAMLYLRKDLFSEKAKCLAACVLERLGVMRDGRWTTVPAEKRLQVYHKAFADDVMRLEAADAVINLCHERADAKFKGRQGDRCNVAYDAIECFWRHTN